MYNKCYGGFHLSVAAMNLYMEEMGYVYSPYYVRRYIDRFDAVMIQIVKMLGSEASTVMSRIKIARFPSKLKGYVSFEEHDGYESVEIDFKSYQLDKIREILNDKNVKDPLECISRVAYEKNTYD